MKAPIILCLVLFSFGSFSGVLEKAHRFFDSGQYQKSLVHYQEALETYPHVRNQVLYNMGICYLELDSVNRALSTFRRAVSPRKPEVSSLAYNQIGLIHTQNQKYPEALDAFKKALKLNTENQEAAFNYELLLRLIEREKENQKPKESEKEKPTDQAEEKPVDDPNKPENDDSEEGDGSNSDGEGEPEEPETETELVPKFNPKFSNIPKGDARSATSGDTISLAKARDILEAMKQNEVRFLQQLKRAPVSSPTDSEKPKW